MRPPTPCQGLNLTPRSELCYHDVMSLNISAPPFPASAEISHVLEGELGEILRKYNPSEHSFFHLLRKLSWDTPGSEKRLGNLYFHLQSVMHATRVMAFRIPHLDRPDQRTAKLQILWRNESEHELLFRVFRDLGASCPYSESVFGEIELLIPQLRSGTARVLLAVKHLFPQSLGAWLLSEMAAPKWKKALYEGLVPQFPEISKEPFFQSGTRIPALNPVAGSLELAQSAIEFGTFSLQTLLTDAREMAVQFDGLWSDLQALLLDPESNS